jgi:hypothetical protein
MFKMVYFLTRAEASDELPRLPAIWSNRAADGKARAFPPSE